MRRTLTRRRSLALVCCALAAAVAAGATLAPHGKAEATTKATPTINLVCGTSITTSLTLGNDLTNCVGTALTITAAHVTLNLNGHTIDGTGSGSGVSANSPSDTVQNGTIREFGTGVTLLSTAPRVQSVRIESASTGITSQDDNAVITGNTIVASTSHGINVVSGGHVQITNNTIRSSGGNGIQTLANDVTITGNKSLSNASYGIYSSNGIGIVVSGNLANGNGGAGIQLGGHDTVGKNTANYNTGLGINASAFDIDSGGNVAKGNGNLHQCANVVCP